MDQDNDAINDMTARIGHLEEDLDEERGRGLPYWAYTLIKHIWYLERDGKMPESFRQDFENIPKSVLKRIKADTCLDDFLDVLKRAATEPWDAPSYTLGTGRQPGGEYLQHPVETKTLLTTEEKLIPTDGYRVAFSPPGAS